MTNWPSARAWLLELDDSLISYEELDLFFMRFPEEATRLRDPRNPLSNVLPPLVMSLFTVGVWAVLDAVCAACAPAWPDAGQDSVARLVATLGWSAHGSWADYPSQFRLLSFSLREVMDGDRGEPRPEARKVLLRCFDPAVLTASVPAYLLAGMSLLALAMENAALSSPLLYCRS